MLPYTVFAVHSCATVHCVRNTHWRCYRTLCSQYTVALPYTVFAIYSGDATLHCVRNTECMSSHACMFCFSQVTCCTAQHAALQQPACDRQRSAVHNSRSVTLSNTHTKKTRPQSRNKRILPVKNGAALINQFLTVTCGSLFMDNNFIPFRFKWRHKYSYRVWSFRCANFILKPRIRRGNHIREAVLEGKHAAGLKEKLMDVPGRY